MDKFLALTSMSFRHQTAFRFNVLLGTLGMALQVLVMTAVWTALDNQGSLQSVASKQSFITYSVLAFAMGSVFAIFMVYTVLSERIKKGDVGLDLIRPSGLRTMLLARFTGSAVFRLFFVFAPFIIIAKLLLDISIPQDPLTWAAFTGAAVMGFLLQFSTWFLFGLLSFVSMDNMGVLMTYNSLAQLFSGMAFPFWIYPPWLRAIAEALPFQGIYSIPLNIYLGRTQGPQILWDLGFQALWLAGLWIFGALLWRLVMKKIVVQGG